MIITMDSEQAGLTPSEPMVDEAPIVDETPSVEDEAPVSTAPISTAPASARLILRRGGVDTDIEFPFTAPAIIGRFDPTVGPIDIDLGALQPEGSYISRKHARIVFEDGTFVLEDLGSSNGSFLKLDDFERMDRFDLADGSEFALGNARFVLRL